MSEITHFTAWLVNDATALSGPHMDVTVMQDTLIGDPEDHDSWVTDTSKGTPFYAETTVPVDGGRVEDAQDEVRHLLENDGWRIAGEWAATPNAYVVPVERIA